MVLPLPGCISRMTVSLLKRSWTCGTCAAAQCVVFRAIFALLISAIIIILSGRANVGRRWLYQTMLRKTSVKLFPSLDRSRTEFTHGFAGKRDPSSIDDVSNRHSPVVHAIVLQDFITATRGPSEMPTLPILMMAVVFEFREVLVGGVPFDDMKGSCFHSTDYTLVVWLGSVKLSILIFT
jgi:hypothetical protein